jgi:V/A-type H+-transporting ATPase subunit K
MNINWMRIALVVLFATLAVTLIADFAAAEGEDNEQTISASAKLGAGIALAGCGIGTGLGQGQIGAAAVGMIAEDSSKFGTGLLFTVLPETVVLFGFLAMFLL